MTVKELRELLDRVPDGYEVLMYDDDCTGPGGRNLAFPIKEFMVGDGLVVIARNGAVEGSEVGRPCRQFDPIPYDVLSGGKE